MRSPPRRTVSRTESNIPGYGLIFILKREVRLLCGTRRLMRCRCQQTGLSTATCGVAGTPTGNHPEGIPAPCNRSRMTPQADPLPIVHQVVRAIGEGGHNAATGP